MEPFVDVLAATGDDWDVQEFLGVREGNVGIAPITHEHGVLSDDQQQVGRERAGLEIAQNMVRDRAAAVADDENTVVLVGR